MRVLWLRATAEPSAAAHRRAIHRHRRHRNTGLRGAGSPRPERAIGLSLRGSVNLFLVSYEFLADASIRMQAILYRLQRSAPRTPYGFSLAYFRSVPVQDRTRVSTIPGPRTKARTRGQPRMGTAWDNRSNDDPFGRTSSTPCPWAWVLGNRSSCGPLRRTNSTPCRPWA